MFKKLIILVIFLLVSTPVFAQSVDTAWVRRYIGPGASDIACAIAVDDSGNVYVTGESIDGPYGGGYDYATIKYDAGGNQVWVRRYNGPGNNSDAASAIAVDNSGNVYVTGYSLQSDSQRDNRDYATIKYYPDGTTAWVKRYNGPGNDRDVASAIAVDGSGNVYVTGYSAQDSQVSFWNFDYATIKYYPDGTTAWVNRYNGPGNNDDYASAIAIDRSGNVYVTGTSSRADGTAECTTIKYDSNGASAWESRYGAPGSEGDEARAIAVDKSGNVYVTGRKESSTTDADYLTIKYYPNGDTAWVRRHNGPGNGQDVAAGIVVDNGGNIYVAGADWDSVTSEDYTTIKYYPDGDVAWIERYDVGQNSYDVPIDMAIDASGDIYMTGESDLNYCTVKYSTLGNLLWVQKYSGSTSPYPYNVARAITVDHAGNVYVTGESWGGSLTGENYVTIKYVQNYNGIIAGTVTDASSQQKVQEVLVEAFQGGILTGSVKTNISGQYSIPNLSPGTYYVRASKSGYQTQTRVGINVSAGQTTAVDFELNPSPTTWVDLAVTLWGSTRARAGFQKTYFLSYVNLGSDNAEDVVLNVKLPKEVQYVSCNPTCQINGQNVSWDLGTVAGGSMGSTSVEFYIPSSVSVGTILKGTAKITTASKDKNPRNDRSDEQEEVVNSWDPNEKEAQPWGGGTAKYVIPDQPLRYTIFFENDSSATAEAIYIDIVDTLDVNLDWSTLEIGLMSHPDTCKTSFDPISGVLSWRCDSIMLPPNHNPPEGQGFVSFWANPNSGTPFGTQIKNRAYIKFDYNPWMATPDSGPVIRTIGKFGDATADGQVNVSDVIFLVNYLFKGGPEPVPFESGDVNCDGKITVSDVVYLINYLFKGGPPPCS